MLYNDGTITVITGSYQVSGNGTLWLGQIDDGSWIEFNNTGVWYQIARVLSRTDLRLSVPYAGGTLNSVPYRIVNDFTPNYGVPHPRRYDVDKASIVSRAFKEFDTLIKSLNDRVTGVEFPPLQVPVMDSTPDITQPAILVSSGLLTANMTVQTSIPFVAIAGIQINLSAALMDSTPTVDTVFMGTILRADNNVFTADANTARADGSRI